MARYIPVFVLTVLITFLMTGCQAPSASPIDATAAIAEQNKKFVSAITAKDAAAIAALYSEDAILLPPNAPAVNGRDAIQAYWKAFLDSGVTNGTLKSSEVVNTDTDATEVGTWTITAPDGTVVDNGKYIVWWKRKADGWYFYRDIFNSDR